MSLGLSTSKDFTKSERIKRMADIEKWAAGDVDLDTALEYIANVEITDIDIGEMDVKVRTQCNFIRAMIRDRDYSIAGRKRLFDLGVHNAMRELYQGIKIAIDIGDL